MKKFPFVTFAVAVICAFLILETGCRHNGGNTIKPGLPKQSSSRQDADTFGKTSADRPSPTVKLQANPPSIEKGKATTLTWETSNATGVSIDNGIGTVEAFGSRTVRPTESTTYKIRATNAVAAGVAEVRVTVTPVDVSGPSTAMSDAEFFDGIVEDVFFDLNEYNIRSEARTTLQSLARVLTERPNIRITVGGHCDERGSSKHNLVLGDKRANAVKDYLVSLGIASNRIETISYGEENGFCEESTEECWQLNRRGHIVMR